MEDRELTIVQWHDKIYQVLIKYHDIHPDFRFPLRRTNRSNKLEKGLWFFGEYKKKNPYLLIGLTENGDGKSKVKTVAIFIRFTSDEQNDLLTINAVQFLVVCRDQKNQQYQDLFQKIVSSVGLAFTGWDTEYSLDMNYSGSIEQTLFAFLDSYWQSIKSIYEQYPLYNFYIRENSFQEYLNRRSAVMNGIRINEDTQEEMPYVKLLRTKKQLILQGAPGVGKTYATKELAILIIGESVPYNRRELTKRYAELVDSGRIAFTTFHQSMDYEDFVEGYKPLQGDDGSIGFELKEGIFRQICERCHSANLGEEFEKAYKDFVTRIAEGTAVKTLSTLTHNKPFDISKNTKDSIVVHPQTESATGMVVTKEMIRTYILEGVAPDWKSYTSALGEYLKKEYKLNTSNQESSRKPHVLIIDEINRGNVSKIFGELITVLETDKREADPENPDMASETITVKLTYSHTDFTVPYNLYIIGTMNTADRSLGQIDYALRRRFAFYTLKSDRNALEKFYEEKPQDIKDNALRVYDLLDDFFRNPGSISSDFNPEDIMIGHSYLMAETMDALEMKIKYELIPLMEEYRKDGLICCQEDTYKQLIQDISAGAE